MSCASVKLLLLVASLPVGSVSQVVSDNNRAIEEEGGPTEAPVAIASVGDPIGCVCGGRYRVGDPVTLIRDYDGSSSSGPLVGAVGVVLAGASLSDPPLLVEWTDLSQGHDGNCGAATCGSCVTRGRSYWYVFCDDVVNSGAATSTTTTTTDMLVTTTPGPAGFEVQCLETSMSVRLPPAAQEHRILGSEAVGACRPQIDGFGNALFDVAFEGACNVSRLHNSSHFIHIITLVPIHGSIVLLDVAGQHTVYTARCVASAFGMVEVSVGVPQGPGTVVEENRSSFTPVLRVFASDSFDAPLAPGSDVPADAIAIYLQVLSQITADNIGWLNCSASPTDSEDDPYAVPLLVDSCSVGPLNPRPTAVENVSHVERLTVPLFKFAGSSQVYFKCLVVRCPRSSQCGECRSRGPGDGFDEGLGGIRRLLDEADTAAVGIWLRPPKSADVLPGPVAEVARTLWEKPTSLPVLGGFISNITLYGCDANPTQQDFREAVAAAIATELDLKEADVQVTRVAVVSEEDLRRRLRVGVGAIVVDYVLLRRPERALTRVDSAAFIETLHLELSERGAGSALGGRASFAPAVEFVAGDDPAKESEPLVGGGEAPPTILLVGAVAGGGCVVCLAGLFTALLCLRRRQRQEVEKASQ